MEKQLSALDKEMSTLDKIGKVLGDVRPGDVIATATLSPEARQVYSYLLSGLEQGNKEVQKSARAAALVAARMTDRLVSFHREAGEAGYTAMDALPELLTNAGQETQEKEAAQRFAQAVESQKEAVRRQYEGTEMWMKAPNGQPTNLTEDQWLAVRTPAFKAWFGDWEAEAEKQKYLNSAPIEVAEKQIVKSDGITARDAAMAWADVHLPVQVSTRFGIVEINRASVKDSLGHGFSQKKLDAITSLPEGMKSAAFIKAEKDFDGSDIDNGYFCYPIMYQGERQVVFCRARRDVNSNKLYVHEVWMEDEIKGIPLQTAAKFLNSKPHGGNALYKSILADFLNNSNTASKVVDENGEPLVVYHGTTGGDFAVFDRSYGSAEGDMGNGFYFTDQFDDVTENYEGGGPDFENKIARLAEKIEAEEEIDYEEAKERARKDLDKGAALYETFLKIAYPAYVDHTILFSDEAELDEDINADDYENEDEYEEAMNQAREDAWSDIVDDIVDKVNYEGYSVNEADLRGIYWDAIINGGISIAELKKQLADLYITDDSSGDIANNEVLRITIDKLGYDGIVDSTVSDKFSNMNLDPETTHYIAFEPTQIKSVDNNGNFSADDPNIYHQANGGSKNNLVARQEKEGEKENRDNEISQEVFRTYLNDGIMRSVEKTVADEIGQYTNLDAMADPLAKDKARDELPYIRKMLTWFNQQQIQDEPAYKDRLAVKIEYARRCFDNDERIQSRIIGSFDGNEGQGRVNSSRDEAVSRDDKGAGGENNRRSARRVSNQVSGEKRGAREHFEKLYNEIAPKHSENQGAFSHGLRLEQSAWHGSPHIFDRFDLGAIGTGEGAQAHGWGLYFTKNKKTAEGYRWRLTDATVAVSYDGKRYEWSPTNEAGEITCIDGEYEYVMSQDKALTDAIGAFIGADGDKYEALDILDTMIRQEIGDEWSEEDLEDNPKAAMLQEAYELLENEWERFNFESVGSLFEVDIPDEDVLLDEQKPFKEQSPKVQKGLWKLIDHLTTEQLEN